MCFGKGTPIFPGTKNWEKAFSQAKQNKPAISSLKCEVKCDQTATLAIEKKIPTLQKIRKNYAPNAIQYGTQLEECSGLTLVQ